MRAAIYIRVSDEDQVKDGYSIEAQKTLLTRKANELGYDIYNYYIDEGYSAKDMRRPSLKKLMKDVEDNKLDVVLFWRLDRWTRNTRDFHLMEEILHRHNVGIRSATEENVDTTKLVSTAIGEFQIGLNVLLAQMERKVISERVHMVMEERHLKGLRNGAVSPYGYDLVEGKLIVNEAQARVVKRIFDMYASNMAGFREIAMTLNHDPTKPDDREWNYTSVRYILMNPVYTGKLRWNYRRLSGKPTGREIISEGDHTPIIDADVFEKVEREIKGRKTGGKVATSDFAFAGVLRCNRCGYAMTGFSAKKRDGRHRYYRCTKRAQNGTCNMPIVLDKKVQEAFLNALDYDANQLRAMIDIKQTHQVDENKKTTDRLKKELETVQKRKKKWQIAYADDAISLEDFKERTREDKEREEQILRELHELPQEETPQRSKEEMIEYLSMVRDFWQLNTNEKAKKAFLRDLFKTIIIDSDQVTHGGPGKFTEVKIVDWQMQ